MVQGREEAPGKEQREPEQEERAWGQERAEQAGRDAGPAENRQRV